MGRVHNWSRCFGWRRSPKSLCGSRERNIFLRESWKRYGRRLPSGPSRESYKSLTTKDTKFAQRGRLRTFINGREERRRRRNRDTDARADATDFSRSVG